MYKYARETQDGNKLAKESETCDAGSFTYMSNLA